MKLMCLIVLCVYLTVVLTTSVTRQEGGLIDSVGDNHHNPLPLQSKEQLHLNRNVSINVIHNRLAKQSPLFILLPLLHCSIRKRPFMLKAVGILVNEVVLKEQNDVEPDRHQLQAELHGVFGEFVPILCVVSAGLDSPNLQESKKTFMPKNIVPKRS